MVWIDGFESVPHRTSILSIVPRYKSSRYYQVDSITSMASSQRHQVKGIKSVVSSRYTFAGPVRYLANPAAIYSRSAARQHNRSSVINAAKQLFSEERSAYPAFRCTSSRSGVYTFDIHILITCSQLKLPKDAVHLAFLVQRFSLSSSF